MGEGGVRMSFQVRYAQEKGGQKLHLVPILGNDEVGHTAFCGKHTDHWRMTINLPLGAACKNCQRVNYHNGRRRLLTLLRQALDAYERGERP